MSKSSKKPSMEEIMKSTKAFMVRLVALMIVLLAALPGQAAEKTYFTATISAPAPESIEAFCPGYPDVTSNYPIYPYCPDRTNIRNYILTRTIIDASIPELIDGVVLVEMNVNFDMNLEGPYWGKNVIHLSNGTVFEGNASGSFSWAGPIFASPLVGIDKSELHASEGPMEGFKLKFEAYTNLLDPSSQTYLTGYLIDPRAKE
jgi:hypothetical protein